MMRKKNALSLLTCGALTLSLVTPAFASASDLQGHWAEEAMDTWMDYGVIQGYGDGTVKPNNSITRGELAVMLDRMMGYQTQADNTFSDLGNTWYTDAILGANKAGIIGGYANGTVKPGATITRQEAVVMIARVLSLSGAAGASDVFTDSGEIAPWALDAVNAMVDAGYIHGSNGEFRPDDGITRAEIVTILDNIFGGFYQSSGTYTETVDGSLVVNSGDVSLEGVTIKGDLIIAEGVSANSIVLDGVTVEGRIIVRGGGTGSDAVVIKGDSDVGTVVVQRQDEPVEIDVQGKAQVDEVVASSGTENVTVGGAVDTVTVEDADTAVEIAGTVNTLTVTESAANADVTVSKGASVGSMTTEAANTNVNVAGTIKDVTVSEGASNATVSTESGAKVDKVTTSGEGTTVEGSGSVSKVEAAQGSTGATVTTPNTTVQNNGIGSVDTGKGEVKPGTTGNTTGGTTSSGGSSVDYAGQAKTALKNTVKNAGNYQYDPAYQYSGTYTVMENGDELTINGTYTLTAFGNGTNAMYDMARFFGALYYQDTGATVKSITYNGETYTWANGENANNTGSNWVKDANQPANDGNTLVSKIVDDYQAKGTIGDLTLNGNYNASITVKLVVDVVAEVTNESDLKNALAGTATTIYVNGDITITDTVEVPSGKTLVINEDKMLTVGENAELHIKNGSALTNNGTITCTGTNVSGKVIQEVSGTLSGELLSDITHYRVTGDTTVDDSCTIPEGTYLEVEKDATLTIPTGASLTSKGAGFDSGIHVKNDGTLTVEGTVTIEGQLYNEGTINGTGTIYAPGYAESNGSWEKLFSGGYGTEQTPYEINNLEQLENAATLQISADNANYFVVTSAEITAPNNIEFTDAAVLDINDATLTVTSGTGSIKSAQGKSLTVKGSGTINGVLYAEKNSTLIVNGDTSFEVNSSNVESGHAVYGGMGTTIEITGGTYTASHKGSVINVVSGKTLSMKNATVNVDSASMINSIGITGNASNVYLENITVNAQYSRAVYLNNQYGSAVIKGGTFITDKVSPEWNPNPTIQYAGTLDISDASITRVGNGILYKVNWPVPTEVKNLTTDNLTFTLADDAVDGYKDINFG